jgi:hypothetical protein
VLRIWRPLMVSILSIFQVLRCKRLMCSYVTSVKAHAARG